MLLVVWCQQSFAPKLKDRKVILVVEGEAFMLTSDDGVSVSKTQIELLRSSQEETDSRLLLYCNYAQQASYTASFDF